MKTPRMLCAFMLALSMMTVSLLRGSIYTTLNNNDPAPLYTTSYTYNYLNTYYKEFLKGHMKTPWHEAFALDITPFYQRASHGHDYLSTKTELGNLQGRWNMLAVLPFDNRYCGGFYNPCTSGTPPVITDTYTDLPCGQSFPDEVTTIRDNLLIEIANNFGTNDVPPQELRSIQGLLEVQRSNTSLNGNFGYFSVPIRYRKAGVRFNIDAMLFKGFGINLCTGIASITQLPTFVDLTPTTTGSNPFSSITNSAGGTNGVTTATWLAITREISRNVMANNDVIAQAYGYDVQPYRAASIEDLNGEIFWRHAIPINRHARVIPTSNLHEVWTKYLFIPFFAVGGSIAIGKEKCYAQKFSLPFGNNGSNAIRARAGISLDFFDTIELAGEFGFTHFSSRIIDCFPVPNNIYQEGIFPFMTKVCMQPGDNVHAAFTLNAYNFDSTVSYYLQYLMVSHARDCIKLLPTYPASTTNCSTTAFDTSMIQDRSSFKSHVFNTAFNVEIAPNMRLGIGAQIPLAGVNVYTSTTFLGTLEMGF